MPANHNRDRVIKRFLPWIFALAFGGIIYYLYAPYQAPTEASESQNAHDTASETQSLTPETEKSDYPETIEEKANTSAQPSETTKTTAEPHPSTPAPENSANPDKQPTDAQPSAPSEMEKPEHRETIEEKASTDAQPSEKPEITNEAQNAPSSASSTPKNSAKTSSPIQDNTPGTFVKHLFSLKNTRNAWNSLTQSTINPVLLKQLNPIKKQLLAPYQSLNILYTDYERGGEKKPENSKILAVQTERWTLFSREKNGEITYYDQEGNAPELAMSRVPFAYTRISSPFNLHRRHPITHRIRPHEGVDLKGPYGTPIASTGNGTVTYAGWQSGYGRVIIIDHNNSYQTRYAHLSAIGVSAGQTIKRGQIIGRLGNSGASTGAHLHYEVRINGTPYDPMTVTLPSYQPLNRNERDSWKQYAKIYLDTIAEMQKQHKK